MTGVQTCALPISFRLHGGNRSGDRTRAEHAQVVDALLRGDQHAAAAAMRSHLCTARHRTPGFTD